ncbi:aldo/keto reductase [Alkalibacterium kapii]|uniref:General stress protein n=1 Tax=Alkalibacterium kapii TaxID=426704 RepID=A0A511AUR2_9LACT|nr:aldo/keto reductase [Alkalibacterium kapii]GEK91939.1 general stress protein [Alkalibacterium kapii]
MKKRMLGKTGIEVSEVGFSVRQLSNDKEGKPVDEDEAIRLIHEAHMHGCFFFDTAINYAEGKNEERLGEALKEMREEVVISSKLSLPDYDNKNFDPDDLLASVENSLKRLDTDYLDILLLDKPSLSVLDQQSPQFQTLEKLKGQGKIRAYGASVDSGTEINHILDNTDSQVVEVRFNIFHQEPLNEMSRAYNEDIGLIVKTPLDSGWLTGEEKPKDFLSDDENSWSSEERERRSKLIEKVRNIINEDASMTQAAIGYILAYKEVATVVPTARTSEELLHNLEASQDLLTPEMIQDLRGLWIEEIKDHPLNR